MKKGGTIINIELDLKDYNEKYKILIKSKLTLVYVNGDSILKNRIISVLSGKDSASGKCQIGNKSTSRDIVAYKRTVDCIRISDIDSELSVIDYLSFFAMLSNNYYPETKNDIINWLKKAGVGYLIEQNINSLTKVEKIIVRTVATRIKNASIVIYDSILSQFNEEERAFLHTKIMTFMDDMNVYCLFFEMQNEKIKEEIKVITI